jgi:hypothetical protein
VEEKAAYSIALRTAGSKAFFSFLSDSDNGSPDVPRAPARASGVLKAGNMEWQESGTSYFFRAKAIWFDEKTDWVSFMIKLLRAYGGCLGARRR